MDAVATVAFWTIAPRLLFCGHRSAGVSENLSLMADAPLGIQEGTSLEGDAKAYA
jgi:hypothetical protein